MPENPNLAKNRIIIIIRKKPARKNSIYKLAYLRLLDSSFYYATKEGLIFPNPLLETVAMTEFIKTSHVPTKKVLIHNYRFGGALPLSRFLPE